MPNLIRFGTGGRGASISAPIIGKDFNWSGGDGTYQVIDDGGGNWRIKFLSSGTFTPLKNMVIDAFLVGAGGGSGSAFCGSGGSGYTTTVRSVVLAANTAYPITVGAAGTNGTSGSTDGGGTTAFSASAAGGKCSANGTSNKVTPGGNGGSGGGGAGNIPYGKAAGGTDGSDGTDNTSKGGTGQGTTTREFGEADGTLYASGGGSNLTAMVSNSGNGGRYQPTSGSVEPADGIVVIRQHKEVAA